MNQKKNQIENIWCCKTVTFDVKKGTLLLSLIDALKDICNENSNLIVPTRIQFSFSEMTEDEVNKYYESCDEFDN